MPLDVAALFAAMESHALATGLFESVNGHEPKRAPGNGLTCAIWSQEISPLPESSGLQSTTGLVTFYLRIFQNMLMEPQDAIDPLVMTAVDKLFTAYTGDFTLGGTVRNVDLLGENGTSLRALAGYVSQDGKLFRVMTITIPLIINDIWEQFA